jgi:hypothetical protein
MVWGRRGSAEQTLERGPTKKRVYDGLRSLSAAEAYGTAQYCSSPDEPGVFFRVGRTLQGVTRTLPGRTDVYVSLATTKDGTRVACLEIGSFGGNSSQVNHQYFYDAGVLFASGESPSAREVAAAGLEEWLNRPVEEWSGVLQDGIQAQHDQQQQRTAELVTALLDDRLWSTE